MRDATNETKANETKTGSGILAARHITRLRGAAAEAPRAVAPPSPAPRPRPGPLARLRRRGVLARRLAEFAERAEALEPEEEEEEEEEEDEGANDDETEPETKAASWATTTAGASMDVDASTERSSSFGPGWTDSSR